jgi:hypothetical protein
LRTIIAGCRHWKHPYHSWLLDAALKACPWTDKITSVVCGMATGIDTFGYIWGKANGLTVAEHPARWELYGKQAGFIRNGEMAQVADAALIVWDEQSRGTKSMIQISRMHRLTTFVLIPTAQELSWLASSISSQPCPSDLWARLRIR